MITRVGQFLLAVRRQFTQSEWAIRLLSLPRYKGVSSNHGLVVIQIDGLSRKQFEHACEKGRMPFLKKLRGEDYYRLHSFYSGLPSPG